MRPQVSRNAARRRKFKLGACYGSVICGAALAAALAPPGALAATPASHHIYRHKPVKVAAPAPTRLVMPGVDYAGAFSDPRGAYTARPVWLKADPRPATVDYDLDSAGSVGSVGLKPVSDNHFTASALPAPTGLPGAGAPEVTVGASVSHPF